MNEYIIELPELGEITVDFETGPEFTIEATGVPGRQGDPGIPGQDGQDGVSPTVTVTDITGGHRVTITDATGAHSFDVMDGESGGDVTDVQVNGTSVVTDGVANVPIGRNAPGALWVSGNYGLGLLGDGRIIINPVMTGWVKAGTWGYAAINPSTQHYATFYGLAKIAGSDEKDSALPAGQYTEAAKSAISIMLNSPVSVTGTTPTITALSGIQYVCGEVATLDITLPASGIVDVVFESGSTPTVLTITPSTGVTVKWANGFDPTTLETNTTYEIRILNGQFATATAWN